MSSIWFSWRGVFVVLLLSSCVHHSDRNLASSDTNNGVQKLIHITIVHTNDCHGHAWPLKRKDGVTRGGFAAQSALIQKLRQEALQKGDVFLVLSAGDFNTGIPESDLIDAEPDIAAMNHIKYDALVIGNHEFDGGLTKLLNQLLLIRFPVLTANITFPGTEFSKVAPYLITERKGVKIGILGLTTDTLKHIILPSVAQKLEVQNAIEVAKKQIDPMKAKGAELLIALTHIGISSENGGQKRYIENDEVKLAKEVPALKLIVGGHSHTLLKEGMRVGDSLLAQAGDKGEYLGRVDITWDKEKQRVISSTAQVIPVLPEQGEDTQVKKLFEKYEAKVSKILDEKLGSTQNELDGERDSVRHKETNFGNFITDVMRKVTKSDVALFNGGGIRASIPRGTIQLRDLMRALPFRNTLVTGFLTGKQLKEVIQTGIKHQFESGSFLQASGITVIIRGGDVVSLKVNGSALSEQRLYKVASNNFVYGGGDYLEIMTQAKDIIDLGTPLDEVLAKYIRSHPVVYAKTNGRIKQEQ